MCVRCGTGRIAWCTDPFRHERDAPEAEPEVIQVILPPALRESFEEWLHNHNQALVPLHLADEGIPTFIIGIA